MISIPQLDLRKLNCIQRFSCRDQARRLKDAHPDPQNHISQSDIQREMFVRCLATGRITERRRVTMGDDKLSLKEIMKLKYCHYLTSTVQLVVPQDVVEGHPISDAAPPPLERSSRSSSSPRMRGTKKVRPDAALKKGLTSVDCRTNAGEAVPDNSDESASSSALYMEAASLAIMMTKKLSLMRMVSTIKCLTALRYFSDSRSRQRLSVNKAIAFWKCWQQRLEAKDLLRSIMV